MKNIVINGASGDLGRGVTRLLLREVPHASLRLVTRTPQKLKAELPNDIKVFEGEFDKPDLLEKAYAGCDVLLLISGTAIEHRVPQHRNAINAAKKAGIKHIVYTSFVGIHPQNPNLAERDHIVTERDLLASGLKYTIVRDAVYADWVYRLSIEPALRTGTWLSIKGQGRLAPVAKEDVVRSVAKILTNPEFHANAIYEISGPDLFTFRQIAELASEVFNTPLDIKELTPEERLAEWDKLGVPRETTGEANHPDALWCGSGELVSGETAIAQMGYQGVLSDHVRFITGRKPRPFRSVLEEIARERNAEKK